MSVHPGPEKLHLDAVERWPDGAFAYPHDRHAPWMTAACRGCGACCDRRSMRCRACADAERTSRCVRGHDLTDPANVRLNGQRHKQCRACDAERARAKRAERTPEQVKADSAARSRRRRVA